jgi:hypothetical protein
MWFESIRGTHAFLGHDPVNGRKQFEAEWSLEAFYKICYSIETTMNDLVLFEKSFSVRRSAWYQLQLLVWRIVSVRVA